MTGPDRPGPPNSVPRAAGWVAVLVFVLALAGALFEQERQIAAARERDAELAGRAVNALDTVAGTIAAAATATAMTDGDGVIPEERFDALGRILIERPGVLSVAMERLVVDADRPAFEVGTGIRIQEPAADGGFARAGRRDRYLVIVRVWPESFSSILGRDILADRERAAAADHARDTGAVAVTAPIDLGPAGRPGVLLMTPLYPAGSDVLTVHQRRASLTGMVTVGLFAEVFLTELRESIVPGARVRISDGTRVLAETEVPPAPEAPTALLQVAQRTWEVAVGHPVRSSPWTAWVVFLAGSAVAAVVAWSGHRSVVHAHRMAAVNAELAEVVAGLQRGLLHDRIDLPADGVAAVVRYVPAAEHARLGGDWYDVFRDIDGRIVVTIGDVAGHGVDAVVQMQQIRQVVAAYAYAGRDPAEVLRLTDRALGEVRPRSEMTTMWIGRIDAPAGLLVTASAGHPPALLAPDGAAPRRIGPATGPPLNLPMGSRPSWGRTTDVLPIPCTLVVYTDGMVESRGQPLDHGIDRLLGLLEEPGTGIDELADEMVASRPDPGRDDAALVVLRVVRPEPSLLVRVERAGFEE